jgi:hypothetical protein
MLLQFSIKQVKYGYHILMINFAFLPHTLMNIKRKPFAGTGILNETQPERIFFQQSQAVN